MRSSKLIKKGMSAVLSWLILVLLIISSQTSSGASLLNVTVTTNKQEYCPAEDVYINGSLKLDGTPVEDALIGVEIRDRAENPYVFRTRPTGAIVTENWLVSYTSLFSCDSHGNPKSNFKKGETLYIFFTIRNFDQWAAHDVIVCITLYDANSVPAGAWYPLSVNIQRNSTISLLFMATSISDSMAPGIATIYGSIYSSFPKDGGFPYCPEKLATFTITTSASTSTLLNNSILSLEQGGSYDVSFKIPSPKARLGNYTIYVSCYYEGQSATDNTTFKVVLKGDINDDKTVNYLDAILLGAAFGSAPGDPRWNPDADINGDETVNYQDAIILGANFGMSGE